MSSVSTREERLREEVVQLREELRRLTLRVDRQSDQLEHLEIFSEQSGRSVADSSFISEAPSARGGSEAAGVPAGTSLGSYSVVEEPVVIAEEAGPVYTWAYREQIARGIGCFLARSLAGENRGNSGRDRLRGLQSRHYIVIRDFDGQVTTSPVRILTTFTAVKSLCKRPSGYGDSIFVGVPSLREAKIAVETAGFSWPPQPEV